MKNKLLSVILIISLILLAACTTKESTYDDESSSNFEAKSDMKSETDDVFAIASEEVSLREVVDTHHVEQISPGEVMVYEI